MKKILRITLITLLALILVMEIGLLATGNLYVNKVLAMTLLSGKTGPDIDELELFPKRTVANGKPQPWPISEHYNLQQVSEERMQEMAKYQTVAYLVVKHDSLLFEQYWENYNEHSPVNSFSMAKSINAILIGCALKEGLIKNVDQPVGDFIPEFRSGAKAKITIRHLLTMSSGIDFKEEYASPLAWPAEAYYGDDVNGITVNAEVAAVPGKTWYYKGGDSQLLGIILKKATGKNVAEYAAEKLWKPIGAEDKAYWSLDRVDGMEKVSCCFYTNARDYARIARLYMHNGNWNGEQIVDTAYVKESVTPAPLVDRAGNKNEKYGFQWWLMKHKGQEIFYMRGIRGQYVFAIPGLDMIVVRLGHKRAPKSGDELPADIFIYLDVAMDMH